MVSFKGFKHLMVMASNLSKIILWSVPFVSYVYKKSLPTTKLQILSPMFPSRSFVVLGFSFLGSILNYYFAYGMR